ncbi:single-stranded DNA-binding protein [Kitasatospora sp. NPDC052896]|uniref:single-stranded DNA-binding protein n=1 Tax=Kitasatospora sp. NPDC052896 TaxID=3364061 RepID=UPI0037C9078F
MVGNVASTVSYVQTAGGVPMANFRLASTERRYDRSRGDWVDGETTWVSVVAWRWLAANVVSSLNKGDPVVVSGRLRVREWEDGGKRRSAVEIDARVVGHDLGRGTSAFRWAVQGRSELVAARMGGPGAPSAGPDGEGLPRGGRGAGGEGELVPGGTGLVGEAVPEWIVAAVRARRAAEMVRVAGVAEGATEEVEVAGGAGSVPSGVGETGVVGGAGGTGPSGVGEVADGASTEPAVPAGGRARGARSARRRVDGSSGARAGGGGTVSG